MNNIIFLDIQGVLNTREYFIKTYEYRKKISKRLDHKNPNDIAKLHLAKIDINRINMLKEVCDITGAKIVITSDIKLLEAYPYIEKKLISKELPIIGCTPNISTDKRGEEIRAYLKENKVDNYVILDDDIFEDFNELINNLVKTSFYNDEGLTEESCKKIVKKLTPNNKEN